MVFIQSCEIKTHAMPLQNVRGQTKRKQRRNKQTNKKQTQLAQNTHIKHSMLWPDKRSQHKNTELQK
jgi:hypothetical protein